VELQVVEQFLGWGQLEASVHFGWRIMRQWVNFWVQVQREQDIGAKVRVQWKLMT